MTKLLSAGYRRLFRSAFFWIGLVAMCVYSLIGILIRLDEKSFYVEQAAEYTADLTLLPDLRVGVFVVGILVALMIGREYSDKTIRNKIIVGHSRGAVYLSNLIIFSTAAAIWYLVSLFGVGLAIGGPVMGGFALPATAFILPAVCQLLALIGFTALFLLVATAISNRTVAAVAILLLAIVLLAIPLPLQQALEIPETTEEMVYEPETDSYVATGNMVPCATYIRQPLRALYQLGYHFLPGGQLEQASPYYKTADMIHIPFWALGFIAAATLGGLVIFKKKELK